MRDIRDTETTITDKMAWLPEHIQRDIFWEAVSIENFKHTNDDQAEQEMREHFLYLAEHDTAELGRIIAEQMLDYHKQALEFQPTKHFKEVG